MNPFFDVTDPDDLTLLPTRLRDNADLPSAAATAEDDVIAAFTFTTRDLPAYAAYYRQGDDAQTFPYVMSVPSTFPPSLSPLSVNGATRIDDFTFVGLVGFDPNPSLCDAALADGLRRAIAKVIRWRLAQWSTGANVQREWVTGSGGKGYDYVPNAQATFPDGWDSELSRWDVRLHYNGA